MKVIERGELADSHVVHLADDQPLPSSGAVTVSLARFARERELLLERGDVGLRLASADTAAEAAPHLDHVERVALEFPAFTDGRSYSNARLLRERYGFVGELRAVGDVLRDQVFFMQRCGFDVLEVRGDKDVADALVALDEFTVTYQTAADGRPPVYHTEP